MRTPILARGLLASALFWLFLPAWAMAQEFEPNNSCDTAQTETLSGSPHIILGELDPFAEQADVDFFRFTAQPGTVLRLDLEGQPTGAGDLGDPFVGWFDSACQLMAFDDDSGEGLNSQLHLVVPGDGLFTVGVTNCCDSGFNGVGQGSYRLSVTERNSIGSISGLVFNAETGVPLSSYEPPYVVAYLNQCTGTECTYGVADALADAHGVFAFLTDYWGQPLLDGDYQVSLRAEGFDEFLTDIFTAEAAANVHLGVLGMSPKQYIGSIGGQLRDALDGSPIPGIVPPWAWVTLSTCDGPQCFELASTSADENGQFHFDGLYWRVAPGDFWITARADGFSILESATFQVGRDEHVDIGDLHLAPFPVRLGELHHCEPVAGQTCRFGIEVSARTSKRLRAEVWSTVEYVDYTRPVLSTRFQLGRNGVANPAPQSLNLASGETRTVMFELRIPQDAPAGSWVCATIFVGESPFAQFHTLAEQTAFCATPQNGVMTRVPDKEVRMRQRGKQGK
ncbi:carboxypeptidase regulatory-like domain-containing protein [Marinihelvus fidelis]|uniref:Carboxypeptidase regulatory-like domain-containing protein n=1 Tax=Marinihelvus fidelis TaxID=2613842 RepID=A0A5N0T8V9_9GAMM|nr:carboxypeptidase-like regulatory domain-containing protein [Marinihelvus fidelis]KAA9130276.1 carboxypeptidase regulatory-like domain-containing protein [Marinihelvus fidelis]